MARGAQAPLELLVYLKHERQSFALPPAGEVYVGRSSQNDIRIDHPSVSRRHLRVVLDEEVVVEDLGSSNGTLLYRESGESAPDETMHSARERRLLPGTRHRVAIGDMLRIGSALVTLQRHRPTSYHQALRPKSEHPPLLLDPQMKELHALAKRAAASDISVLVLGETGVGKEVIAEIIHRHSKRARQPMLRLNCSALSEQLLESELFGYERGAFTGAVQAKPGLLECTDKGTVFLDEVCELPLPLQAKLLRALEERMVRRVGGTKARRIDVRFVSATNRNPEEQILEGKFRRDLFFRINGVQLPVPPLRQRLSEIEPLARLFLQEFCEKSAVPLPELTHEAVLALRDYSWPGNVRELKNVMERVVFMCGVGPILAKHIPRNQMSSLVPDLGAEEFLDVTAVFTPSSQANSYEEGDDERDRIIRALEACGGNQTRAARLLGVSRRTLVNRLESYNLPRPRKA